ncbi:histidine phosphatase family protein [Nocardioides panacis]|uniref:Histidine phosphatase family protein n=1 Tax=Nocardioides panacis TaxID=2849501 RepID=A0A975T0J5_9ACTN|nr:histidine phosphatase family protein [Nocardioides panacis]QWZ08664.1 histidine phosphatase family protein [Nocardioides panacis]
MKGLQRGFDRGPSRMVLVRHGESIGNVADNEARERHADRLDLTVRDADVELSATGEDQAEALGRYLHGLADDQRPTLVLTSPYERAAATAGRALVDSGLEVVTDERLRERDLGQLDGLTGDGIRNFFADEAERRKKVGKFYYQPPGGESWADVVLRVRSLLSDLRHGFDAERLWIFTHQAVIMSFRYVLEGVSESELLAIDRTSPIPNCSLTTYERSGGTFRLLGFADTEPLDRNRAPVTAEPSGSDRGASSHA